MSRQIFENVKKNRKGKLIRAIIPTNTKGRPCLPNASSSGVLICSGDEKWR